MIADNEGSLDTRRADEKGSEARGISVENDLQLPNYSLAPITATSSRTCLAYFLDENERRRASSDMNLATLPPSHQDASTCIVPVALSLDSRAKAASVSSAAHPTPLSGRTQARAKLGAARRESLKRRPLETRPCWPYDESLTSPHRTWLCSGRGDRLRSRLIAKSG